MAYCGECGAELDGNSKFCPNCGSEKPAAASGGGGIGGGSSQKTTNLGDLDVEELIRNPAIMMALAGLLLIIGALGTWVSWNAGGWGGTFSWSGWNAGGGKATLVMGLIMMYSATVKLGYIDIMKKVVPVLSTSAICGVVSLILALGSWNLSFVAGWGITTGAGWGLYLTIVASFVALFAAYIAYTQP